MSTEIEIVDKLISLMVSGKYNAHDKLPSENEIGDQYKMPSFTAYFMHLKMSSIFNLNFTFRSFRFYIQRLLYR